MNPFRYGQVVTGDHFCPRGGLARELQRCVARGQNCVLIGERRMGKTSLIRHVTATTPSIVMYVDLLETKTVEDVVGRLAQAIVSAERRQGWLERALKTLAFLRPTVSLDPVTSLPTVSVDARPRSGPESLTSLLDTIESFAGKHSVVVVLDEFQDIRNLPRADETIAVLRSKIQFQERVTYVFAGSIRNEMEDLFTHEASPLFKSAVQIWVGPLERQLFADFIRKHFAASKRVVPDEVLDGIFETACDCTGDVQQLCAALWDVTEGADRVGPDDLPRALELVFTRELKGYETTLGMVSAQQMKALSGLARLGGDEPTGRTFLETTGIRQPATVVRALNALIKKRVIYRWQRSYRFGNPFFAAWLRHKGY